MDWNHKRKPDNRILSDDILICSTCRQDKIASCADLNTDLNAEIKQAVNAHPTRKGGKQMKSRKTRKSRKSRKVGYFLQLLPGGNENVTLLNNFFKLIHKIIY